MVWGPTADTTFIYNHQGKWQLSLTLFLSHSTKHHLDQHHDVIFQSNLSTFSLSVSMNLNPLLHLHRQSNQCPPEEEDRLLLLCSLSTGPRGPWAWLCALTPGSPGLGECTPSAFLMALNAP